LKGELEKKKGRGKKGTDSKFISGGRRRGRQTHYFLLVLCNKGTKKGRGRDFHGFVKFSNPSEKGREKENGTSSVPFPQAQST